MYDDLVKRFAVGTETILLLGFAVMLFVLYRVLPDLIIEVFWRALGIGIYIIPFVLVFLLWQKWMKYIQTRFISGTSYTLLEIKLPQEITQTPLAMETVLNSLYQTRATTPVDDYIKGVTRPVFSLEIVSLEGSVHFYIQTESNLKNTVESALYAQYPNVEVVEVPDYATRIRYDEKTMKMFVIEQKLEKPDPYPIKTYVEYGLDKAETKEEFKTDPLSTVVEFLGSIGKGEYIWIQYIIAGHIPRRKGFGLFKHATSDWRSDAQTEMDKITSGLTKPDKEGRPTFRFMTPEEDTLMKALSRNVAKKPFDVASRIFYMAYNEHYDKRCHAGIPTIFRAYQSHQLNNLKPVFIPGYDWWWEDPWKISTRRMKRETYEGYRWRSFIFPPYQGGPKERKPFVLSAEELATVFHFPGRVTQTPTLERITSRRVDAPPNLPT